MQLPTLRDPTQKMGDGMNPLFQGAMIPCLEEDGESSGSVSFSSDSRASVGSLSSDLTDDAVSSSPDSPPPPPPATSPSYHPQLDAPGPLYELSSLMAQLPIKRGLSKFFSGKSQSFTSLSNVRCVEDLAKRERTSPCKRKVKPCRSYGGLLLDFGNKSCFTPGPCRKTISKKSWRGSCASLAAKRK